MKYEYIPLVQALSLGYKTCMAYMHTCGVMCITFIVVLLFIAIV